jgi:hypothetical protein
MMSCEKVEASGPNLKGRKTENEERGDLMTEQLNTRNHERNYADSTFSVKYLMYKRISS